jgi:P-type E1-E2 ATPase
MLKFEIPGRELIEVRNLVLDYNGTLAIDGLLIEDVKDKINLLSRHLDVFVITADTFGSAVKNLKNCNCKLKILGNERQDLQKAAFVKELGAENTVSIGNGMNDCLMLKEAIVGVCAMQNEGCAVKTLINADVVVRNIIDAFDLLLNPKRLSATLRC